MALLDFALLKVDRRSPLLPLYQYLDYTNSIDGYSWGEASITGISGKSNGSAVLTFPDLSGITIVSYSSDTGVPTIVGNTITFPSGSFWDIQLSDGTFIPDPNSGYDSSGVGTNGIPTGFTENISTGGSLFFNTNGFNRDLSNKMVPADSSNPGFDVLGNPIEYPQVTGGLNLADGLINYSSVSSNNIYNKDAIQGNVLGLPEVWLSGTTWDYSIDPLEWRPEERSMDYLYSRLTPEYKKIFFTTIIDDSGTLKGIVKEEIFTEQLSDEDAEILNQKNNGINTLP